MSGFFAELKRRKVLQIGGGYIAGAWLVTEVLSFLFDQFQAPDWGYRLIAIVFVAGFPISMILAWMIQVREDGSWTLDPSRGQRRTVLVAIVIGFAITVGLTLIRLRPGEQSDDPQAFAALMSGETRAAAWTTGSLAAAIEDYQTAIDRDPGFVQAYIGLAQSLYDLADLAGAEGDEREQMERRARRAVNIAQLLEPESADALSLIGLGQSNRQMRIVAYERALELDPGHALSYFRYALQMQADGNLEEAEQLMLRAITLQPMNARFRLALAEILEQQGRPEDAAVEQEKAAAFGR